MLFAAAGRRIGSGTVNHARLWLALLVVTLLHWGVTGLPWPAGAGAERFLWLGLSGVVGYAIGDAMLFEGYVRVGPRLSMLMMTLSPVFSAWLAAFLLGEWLRAWDWLAIGVTLAGIGLVVVERNGPAGGAPPRYVSGLLCGAGGALGQAGGLLLAKLGLAGSFSPIAANQIRLTAAAVTMGLLAATSGRLARQARQLTDRRALLLIVAAVGFGPVTGVILSLVAVSHAPLGVAATLMSLSPVLLLPLAYVVHGERVTLRAVIGTLVAVGGAAMLFLGG